MDIPSLRAVLVGHPNHDTYFLFGCFPLLLDVQILILFIINLVKLELL